MTATCPPRLPAGILATAIAAALAAADARAPDASADAAVAAAQAAWERAAGAAEDVDLLLPGGADGTLARFHLERRDGIWRRAAASAPAWDPGSVKEAHAWFERGIEPAWTRRDALAADGLAWDGAALRGTAVAAWRLDATRAERFPAGLAPFLTFEGFYSPLDLFQVAGRGRERRQEYRIDARDEGRRWVDLVCEGLIAGTPMTVSAALPQRPGELVRPRTPRWNVGFHQADLAGLAWDGDRLRGTFAVLLHPDMAMPLRTVAATIAVEAVRSGDELTGTWTAQDADPGDLAQGYGSTELKTPPKAAAAAAAGSLRGRVRRLAEGRYAARGDLGEQQGPVLAAVASVAPPAMALAGGGPATAAWARLLAARAAAGDLRAPADALAAVAGIAPEDPAAAAAALDAFAAAPPAAAEILPATWPDGPPLAADGALPADGSWARIDRWRTLGPLPLALAAADPALPPALPTAAGWRLPGRGEPAAWIAAAAGEDGALRPPAPPAPPAAPSAGKRPAPRGGYAQAAWLAAGGFAGGGEATIAIDAATPVLAWIDGRALHPPGGLVDARPRRLRLAPGAHALIALVAERADGSHLRVHVRSGAPPAPLTAAAPTASGDGDGPLAVDIASGRGVAWSTALPGLVAPRPGGGTEGGFAFGDDLETPVRAGGIVAVVAAAPGAPPAAVGLDAATGAERWRLPVAGAAGVAPCLPAAAGATVIAGARDGTLVAIGADGALCWRIDTGAPLRRIRALAGVAVAAARARDQDATTLIAVDAASGAERWRRTVAANGPFLLMDIGGLGVVLAGDERIRRLSDGADLGVLATDGAWSWPGSLAADGMLVEAHAFRMAAVELRRDGERIASRLRWRTPAFAANASAGSTLGAVAGGRCFALRRPEEFSKHDPCDALLLEWCDLADGGGRGRLKPLHRGLDVPGRPLAMGRFLYIPGFNGSGVGRVDPTGLCVVDIADAPIRVGFIPVDGLGGALLAADGRLLVCAGDRVIALADAADERRRAWAAGVLATLPPAPAAGAIVELPAAASLPAGTPVSRLELDVTPQRRQAQPIAWTCAPGPAGWADAPPPAADAGAPARVRERCRWTQWNRLDSWWFPVIAREVDLRALPAAAGSAWLRAGIDLAETRALAPAWDAEAVAGWIDGVRVEPQRPLRLAAGRHAVVVQVRPQVLAERRPQPPTDVAAALAAGAVAPIAWPQRWLVQGPLGPDGAPAADDPGRERAAVGDDGWVALDDLAAGDQAVLLGAEVEAPAAGHLLINASADWRMAWTVGGRLVLDTRADGNGGSHLRVTARTVAVPVAAGRHRIAVTVMPGSKGCGLRSRGAFLPAGGDRFAVAAAHPAADGRGDGADPAWTAIGFAAAADPAEALAAWRRTVAPQRARLERIAAADGPAAAAAAAVLARLGQ